MAQRGLEKAEIVAVMLRPVSLICSQLEQGNKLTGNIKIYRFGKMSEKYEETLDEKLHP